MVFTTSPQPDPLAETVFEVFPATDTIETLDDSSGTMYQVYIDNSLNANFWCYLKLFCGPIGTGSANELDDTSTLGGITGDYRMYAGGADAATATVVCHADIAEDEALTITSADGTAVTYTGKDGTAVYGNQQFNVDGTANDTADSLTTAINHDGGHDGKLVAVASDATVTLTNATKGASGNVTITHDLNSNATVTGFSGGVDDALTVSGLAEPSFIFPCRGGETVEYQFPEGLPYADKLYACVVSLPGKGGTTPMTNSVVYRISVTT